MKPRKGNALTLVPPQEPAEARAAAKADPGEQAEARAAELEQGRASSPESSRVGAGQPMAAHRPPASAEERQERRSWIEIRLRDQKGRPRAGERYRVVLPDGQTFDSGTLDHQGFARVEGIEPGECRIVFPDIHARALRRAS